MQELVAENYRLVAQVNVLRSALPAGPSQSTTTGMAATALAEESVQVLPMPGTLSRLLSVCSLGHGTATLRDANEGPEPRGKMMSPPSAVPGPVIQPQQSSTLAAVQRDSAAVFDNSNDQNIWHTPFGFTVPASDSRQLGQPPWPLSAHSVGPEIFSVVPPPVDLPPSPGIGLPDSLFAHFSYPIEPIPDVGLHATSLDHDGIGNPWPGLGIC